MCSEFSFYLQFATFMMLLATVPLSMMCVKLMENTPKSSRRRIRGRKCK